MYPANIRLGEDVLKTSSRHNCKTSFWRRLENILKKASWKHVLKTSWKAAWRRLENVLKASCEDVLKTFLEDVLEIRLEEVLKTSCKTKNCYAEHVLKTSWRRLGKQEMFAGYVPLIISFQAFLLAKLS